MIDSIFNRINKLLFSYISTKNILIVIAFIFIGTMILLPLITVFTEALNNGIASYFKAINNPDALSAIKLTLFIAIISVFFNVIFGLCASWAIAKHNFFGKSFLITLLDLPFSVSPVIVGLMYIMMFNSSSFIGKFFESNGIQILFAIPSIILTTIFVTFPFIARELIPLMQEQGIEEEEASILLGASGFRTFISVTLPNIKWGLFYGVLLCNARAMGEFGAVSVVSGHIRGLTNTLPLHVEILYNEYNFSAAFSVASILVFLALITLILSIAFDRNYKKKEEML